MTDWNEAKHCGQCNIRPIVKCNLEWIELTCPICKGKSITHISLGTEQAIEDWNRYHADWFNKI